MQLSKISSFNFQGRNVNARSLKEASNVTKEVAERYFPFGNTTGKMEQVVAEKVKSEVKPAEYFAFGFPTKSDLMAKQAIAEKVAETSKEVQGIFPGYPV